MTPVPASPSRLLGWYTGVVTIVGLGVILHSISLLPTTPQPAGWLALAGLVLVATRFALKLPNVSAYISINDTFFFASALLFGPAPATVTIALDSLLMSWRRKHRVQQLLFNPASSALALWCGVSVYGWLLPPAVAADALAAQGAELLLPLGCMAAVYFVLNSGFTCVAIALSKRGSAFEIWRQHFALIALNYFASASAAFVLVIVLRHAGVVAAAAVAPLVLVVYMTMRSCVGRLQDARTHIERINQLHLSTVGAFATAIEARDGVTSNHIHRVRAYAMALAREVGVTDASTLQALEAAALLHDTGKLAIPEHILNKPGKLTSYEYETMKLHVDIGADILSSIEFPYPVVPIVRAHHESWNGSGYPAGLRGEEIPLGARILSVVDCYDALTSDRPYRPAMDSAEALQEILNRRGIVYDPQVVDAFARICHRLVRPEAANTAVQQALRRISGSMPAVGSPVPAARIDAAPRALTESDALPAFASLVHLTSRDASAVDVGRLAWGLLKESMPGATFALFTTSARDTVTAVFTAGPASDPLSGLTMRMGERISGWVAATQRPMTNTCAELDLPLLTTLGVHHAMSLPLLAGGAAIGAVTVYATTPFAEEQVRQLEMVVPLVSAAIDTIAGQRAVAVPALVRRSA